MTEPALYRLPVRNLVDRGDDSERYPQVYVKELHLVTSPEELVSHVKRWFPLWEMNQEKFPDEPASPAEIEILDGSWESRSSEIWECIQAGRTALCKHLQNGQDCPSAYILMPFALTKATILAQHYHTLVSAVLEQLYGDGRGY